MLNKISPKSFFKTRTIRLIIENIFDDTKRPVIELHFKNEIL